MERLDICSRKLQDCGRNVTIEDTEVAQRKQCYFTGDGEVQPGRLPPFSQVSQGGGNLKFVLRKTDKERKEFWADREIIAKSQKTKHQSLLGR